MNRHKHITSFWLFALIIITGLITSCSGPNKSSSTQEYASVQIQVAAASGSNLAKAISTVNDITKITVDIKERERILIHQDLVNTNDTWTGSFERLPVGIELDFIANAYGDISDNNGPIAIFSGTVRKKLIAGENSITIPITHNTAIDIAGFPDLAINYPSEILINSSKTISIAVSDATDFVTYAITSTGPKGFTPETGIINLISGSGSMNVKYEAPTTVGAYEYAVVATNKKGNSASRSLTLNIVNHFSNGLAVDFSPVITQISIALNGSNLTFEATVVDDKPLSELTYVWSFEGNRSFVVGGANPAVLADYTAGDTGVVHLTVTDASGGASRLSYNITGVSFDGPVILMVGVPDAGYDMVIDKDTTFDGDRGCNTLLVKNNAKVTFAGSVFCNDIVVRNGAVTINGSLNAVHAVSIETNTMNSANSLTIKGNSNSAQLVEIFSSSTLNMLGDWYVKNWVQRSGSKAQVIAYSSTKGSGSFVLQGENLSIEAGAILSANGAGADPRGYGGGYAGSGGGGSGGDGCGGYWSATHAGSAFGDAYSYLIDMGSAGGVFGGGKILIELTGKAVIAGNVTSNGNYLEDRAGGGSGGGILINAPFFNLTGTIEAKGGRGGYYGGGGGGGRIKIFYRTGVDDIAIIGYMNVAGGQRGGYLNTCDGKSGTVWIDAIPEPPELISPNDGTTVDNAPSFSFIVTDNSAINDGRNDDLSVVLEISADNFATIYRTYDQTKDLSGWSNLTYKSGDTATFTSPDVFPSGTYQWRVRSVDRSIAGEWSVISSFIVP